MRPVFQIDDIPWRPVGENVPAKGYEYKQLIDGTYTDAFSCELVKLPPGALSVPHIDKESHALLCLGGEGEISIGDGTWPVKMGTLSLVKRGEKHSLRNAGSVDMTFLVIYDPPFKWRK